MIHIATVKRNFHEIKRPTVCEGVIAQAAENSNRMSHSPLRSVASSAVSVSW